MSREPLDPSRNRTSANEHSLGHWLAVGLLPLSMGLFPLSAASASTADKEWVVIPEDWRSTAPFANRLPELRADPNTPMLDLAGFRFATADLARGGQQEAFGTPDLSSFSTQSVREPFTVGDSDLFIVQAQSPKELVALRARLAQLDIPVKGYLPRFAFLVRLSASDHQDLEDQPEVFWLGLYQPAWRIEPKLDFIIEHHPDHPLPLTAVFLDEDGDPANTRSALLAAVVDTGLRVDELIERRGGLKLRLNGAAANARKLLTLPGCLWVERFADYELHNNVARSSSNIATGRNGAAGPLMDVEDVWARGLRGEGQIAAVSDTGLSTGDPANLHHDFGEQGSASNPLRVIKAYALGRATWDDNLTLGGGHGTHVAGSLVGNGVRSGADPATNSFPTSSYAGTAPKAQLVFQSLLDGNGALGGIPGNLNALFQPPYDDGARVHCNSWGTPLFGAYTADSQEVDEFIWNHPDMVITYTAGNRSRDSSPIDGVVDADAIGAPGTAKNAIVVGASENYRPDFVYEVPEGDCTSSDGIEQKTWGWFSLSNFAAAPIFPDLMADNASGLAGFSSRGPTDDGRLKPDLVAPGIAVISTRTDKFQGYRQWGTCQVPPALRPYYQVLGGTSMANPLVAGAAVLTRQYYAEGWHAEGSRITRDIPEPADGFNPSAALVKATLINGAWDMAPGQYGAGPAQELPPAWDAGRDLPNNAEGYGRLDLEAALFPGSGYGHDAAREMEVHDATAGLVTGQLTDRVIPVASSADPLIVTLVWTDPQPMLGAGSQLINDLDLTVIAPGGTIYYPNGIDRTLGSVDRTNNVEQTVVSAPAVGNWTVRVRGWNVPGNGEPGTATQPYALVVSGVLAPPCATPATPAGLTATPNGSNRIDLAWNAVAADSYSLYRATAPGGPYARIASGLAATSFQDTTVSGGTTYYYAVTAVTAPGCESANSLEVSAVAQGDCSLAPVFSGVSSVTPTNAGGGCGLRISWATGSSSCPGGPLVTNLYRSTSPGFTPGPSNLLASCITGASYDDTAIASGVTYYYVARAEDAVTGGSGPCRGGNTDANLLELSGTDGGDASVLLFADDFDGNQTPADLWQLGLTPPNPYASGSCAPLPTGTGPASYTTDWYRPETGFCGGNALASNNGSASPAYSDFNDGMAVLGLAPSGGPPFSDGGIVLPAGATSITLTFDHDYDFETSSQFWDGGRLLISADNWPNFNALAPSGGYPGTVFNSSFFCHPWPGASAYVGDSVGCIPATYDLTAYAGQRIWLAWNHGGDRFASSDDGWVIDNVRLEASIPSSCTVAPPPVQVLTATAGDEEVRLEWLNPDSPNYDSTIIRFRTDTYPVDPSDGTLVVDEDGEPDDTDNESHDDLTNGTTYYYTAFVDNGAGVMSAARHVSARPFETSGAVRWAYSTGATALAPPGIGSVYAVSNDRVLHSMSTTDEEGEWPEDWVPLTMNGPAQERPPVVPISLGAASKVTFLGSQDRRIYAVDADTGSMLWQSSDLGGQVQAAPGGMFTAFGGAHDLILAGMRNASGDSAFYGLNLADGSIAWSFDNGGGANGIGIISASASLDIFGSRVYFASRAKPGGSNATVWCLSFDDTSASLLWSRALGDIDGSPLLHAGKIYVGTNSGQVHALDALTGADLWALPFSTGDGPIKGYVSPRFGTSQLIFSTTDTVWSILDNGASASLDWASASIPDPSIPLVGVTTPMAWIGGSNGQLHELDLSGGSPSITAVTLGDGGAAIGSPALDVSDGILYAGSESGRVYAVTVPLPGGSRAAEPPPGRSTTPGSLGTLQDSTGELTTCEIRVGSPQAIFADGFESGDLSAWSSGESTFSSLPVSSILDLELEIRFSEPIDAHHLLRLELSTPQGHLYQVLTQPFSGDASQRGLTRRVEGYPRPLAVATLPPSSASRADQALRVAWPVAGTQIVRSSLYGAWSVMAFLDEASTPCSAPVAFTLSE
ncbi:MAG: S8 family serine peptidase [Acidobacteriota bacterium]